MLDELDLSAIADERALALIGQLLNLIEALQADLRDARAEIQRLRDEVNRLKGEQGRPPTKPNAARSSSETYSSERERRTSTPRQKQTKRDRIEIHREEVLSGDVQTLPEDARFKGYEDVIVQDLLLRPENVRFRKEKYYSPSEGRSYQAALPRGYEGTFGPGIKSLVLALYFGGQMSAPKILEWLHHVGVLISAGQLSNLLIQDQERCHEEKAAVVPAGLASSPWQHLDATGTRVNGQNQHGHILCNPLSTASQTTARKDRQRVIDVLRGGAPRCFRFNAEAERYLEQVGLSAVMRARLRAVLPWDVELEALSVDAVLETHLPTLGPQQRTWVLDALAVAASHAQLEWPVIDLLVCDDAPQFALVTAKLALCWVHEGRHYKKLTPWSKENRRRLEAFLDAFWDCYDELLTYRHSPSPPERDRLSQAFDDLFATQTGYALLDERIAKTRAKKDSLLLVLIYPEIPLHNNPAELGARQRVRKRDVSFGPRTDAGLNAWDTFMTLAATTKKLGVSFYRYLHDRVTQTLSIPPLADLITERAVALNLGASWPDPALAPNY